mgnify:CR=1 FL=1
MLLSILFLYKIPDKIQKMQPKLLFILMIYDIKYIISLKYQLKLLVDWKSTFY